MPDLPASPYAPAYQHRSIVSGRNGAIAGGSSLAVAAGLQVLLEGGNAVDAAITVAAVENVTLPMLCGLGGELFCIVAKAGTSPVALGSSGVAPFALSSESLRKRSLTQVPLEGAESVAVPGNVAAYRELANRWGTMPLSRLLAPAVRYAREGFPVGQRGAEHIALVADKLARYPETARLYLPNGRPPRADEVLFLSDLAATLELVAESEGDEFYRGPLADRLIGGLAAGGSPFGPQEFAEHRVDVGEPIHTTYRGNDLYQTPPPSQGLIVLEALNLLEGFDLGARGPLDARTIHLQVEAKRLAYADRIAYLGDPRFVTSPVAQLLSKEYAARRRVAISPEWSLPGRTDAGQPYDVAGSTTSFVVADGSGLSVTLIHSLSAIGGSGLVAPGTGVLFNNRVGRGFSLEEGHPNELAGGKRTMHTLNCYTIHRDGQPIFVGGTPGGDGQPQWNVQVICNLIDFGMNVQQAAEWPRWSHLPGTDPATLSQPWRLEMDGRYPVEITDGLGRLGHPVTRMALWTPGIIDTQRAGVQLIRHDPETGIIEAGSDPRAGGLAIAF